MSAVSKQTTGSGRVDFFVSYTGRDRQWAEWIAWQLEEAGYKVVIQAWDFRPGSNFVDAMQRAASGADRTVAVLSPDYLVSGYATAEWNAAFAQDPTGRKGTLVPIRVRDCDLSGLLPQVVYVDLVGQSERQARKTLIDGVKRGRAKPRTAPAFPGAGAHGGEPDFPGKSSTGKVAKNAASNTPRTLPKGQVAPRAVSTSGALVLLAGKVFKASSVDDRANGTVVLEIEVSNAADDAALNTLRADRHRRTEPIIFAYQNDAFLALVGSADRRSVKGKSRWAISLSRARENDAAWMEVTYNGLGPDAAAQMRAELILLNKQPSFDRKDDPIARGMVEGSNSNRVTSSFLPSLWKQYRTQPNLFLQVGRLWAVYYLKSTGTCAEITELKLGPLSAGRVRVKLVGRRKRVYENQDPAVIRVDGECRLTP